MSVVAHRGEILHFLDDPARSGDAAVEAFGDGLLLVEDGRVARVGDYAGLESRIPAGTPVRHHRDGLLVPGLVDTHIHYPQCDVIAAYGTRLLDWLETHTFPAERRFADSTVAAETASFFLDELLRNGTTTAMVFGTVHPRSVDAFFEQAQQRSLRMICGKVMMDRNAPDYLRDTAGSSYRDSAALIRRWHGVDRLGYAVTPRFAPTSSPEQLTLAGNLLREHPGVHLQTHLAENTEECAWVAELFPEAHSYLDVYDRHGLLGRRSVFAHAIHLEDRDWRRLAQTGSGISHCPLSNLFIGSGLFHYRRALDHRVNTGLGTDVGGGDSFSLLRVINEAYKVQQLRQHNLSPFQSLYLATLGGARTLDLADHIGNFAPGKEADFVVLDYAATPLVARRIRQCRDLAERLFVMEMLGDDRAVRETWILGKKVHDRFAGKEPN